MQTEKKIFNIVFSCFAFAALAFASPDLGSATPLTASLTQFQDTSFITPDKSFDSPVAFYNVFSPLQAFTGSAVFELGSITGLDGRTFEFTNLMGVTFYDGKHGYAPDTLGYFDSQGNFTQIISLGAGVGASVSHEFSGSDPITFGLDTPDGLWSADSSKNSDLSPHALALNVTQAGTLFYNGNADLFGGSIQIDLQVGDIVLLWEDLINFQSDHDYNDFAILIRDTTVPEPSTVLLLVVSLIAFLVYHERQSKSVY